MFCKRFQLKELDCFSEFFSSEEKCFQMAKPVVLLRVDDLVD